MNFQEHLQKYLSKEEIELLMQSLKEKRTHSLILNEKKISSKDFEKLYQNLEKHPFLNNVYYFFENMELGKNFYFDNGLYYIMDSSSMLSSYFLNPKDGELILDMCAAPGGKSIFLSLNNKNVEILSNDISHERCLKMSSNIEKLGLSNITIINYDFSKNLTVFNETFDKILLDAPCSGSAMFRKDDKFIFDWSYEKVIKCAQIQKDLIIRAFDMLKPGGEMIYSTCSFSFEEDEEIINYLLENRKLAILEQIPENPSFNFSKTFPETIHLFPFKYKGEGQYIAKIKKEGKTAISQKDKILTKIKYPITTKYQLNFNYYFEINNKLYGTNNNLNLKNIPIIKRGLQICEIKKEQEIPSFHLAHFLSNENSITLNDEEANKYIKGEEIKKELPSLKKDYYIVSYKGVNLGFIKYVNGTLKNLYPKGLRH